jgi:predicted RNA-binding Zn ribbon-like protein
MKVAAMFNFESNSKCLDFLNTEVVEKNRVVDQITDYDGLIKWLHQARFLTEFQAAMVQQKWTETPAGEEIFFAAKDLRGLIREVAEKIVAGRKLPLPIMDEINRLLRRRKGYTQLMQDKNVFWLQRQIDLEEEPLNLIIPIVESLCRLLAEGDPSRLRRCENPDCIHYFYDISKNRTRRWCSMRLCGNRIKAAAHYRRRKEKDNRRYERTGADQTRT